jgi:hypothetical protein
VEEQGTSSIEEVQLIEEQKKYIAAPPRRDELEYRMPRHLRPVAVPLPARSI